MDTINILKKFNNKYIIALLPLDHIMFPNHFRGGKV